MPIMAARHYNQGKLVRELDDEPFWGFLTKSNNFKSFELREIFGKVGFGTGGWDTDYPSSMLEILRVVLTEADDNHRGVVGGSQQLPLRLWKRGAAGCSRRRRSIAMPAALKVG